jgi:hypothetical protein
LGEKSPAHPKASLGNVVHKALELLSLQKLAIDRRESFFESDEFGIIREKQWLPRRYLDLAFDYYKELEQPQWTEKDYNAASEIFFAGLKYRDGMLNPLNQKVVEPEKRFDFTFDDDWAHYRYELPDGKIIEGQLGIKGTIDLVTEPEPGFYEIIDYKSGQRKDWSKPIDSDAKKEYEDFIEDFQLNLYYYALWKLYPDANSISITIWYIRPDQGNAFTMPFCKADLPSIKNKIREIFECIKNTETPSFRKDSFCYMVCHFGRQKQPGTDLKICKFYENEIRAKGVDQVLLEHGDISKISDYGDGGGRKSSK